MSKNITFTATGDSFISRRLPDEHGGFNEIKNIIELGEFRFTNFEMTTPEGFNTPSAVSGGTWAGADSTVVSDIKKYGFNCVSWANNHTLDYLYDGLRSTQRNLNRAGLVNAGVGENLHEASAPKYMENKNGRIALIGLTTTFNETWKAGEQRHDGPGRPGVNGVSHSKIYQVSKHELEILKNIADRTGINAERNLDILEGFTAVDSNRFFFGNAEFEESDRPGSKSIPDEDDLKRVLNSIDEARQQADIVIVSIHSHDMKGEEKEKAAEYIEYIARKCIDVGADAIIGHGPHILRGIEIYNYKPIFYSLGNFIFQNDTVQFLPAEFYTNYNLPQNSNVSEAILTRNQNDTIGLGTNKAVWESVIAFWEFTDGILKGIRLYPIELGYGMKTFERGWPKLSKDMTILQRLDELSEPYGTRIKIKGNYGEVEL